MKVMSFQVMLSQVRSNHVVSRLAWRVMSSSVMACSSDQGQWLRRRASGADDTYGRKAENELNIGM